MTLFRKILITVLLTTTMCSFTTFIDKDSRTFSWFILVFIITFISFGLPNGLFLLFMYWLNIGRDFLLKTKLLVLEIILLLTIYWTTDKAILLIPIKYKYYSTPTITGQKFAFQAGTIIFYSFVILFIVLFTIDRIKKNKTKKQQMYSKNL